MKKFILLIAVALFIVVWRTSVPEVKNQPVRKNVETKKVRRDMTHVPAQKPTQRIPAQVPARTPVPDLGQSFEANPEIQVGASYVFASDVGAIPQAQYDPQMGALISENKNWSYYKKSPGEASIPAAFSPSKNKFYPISSIIQVKDVGPDLRDDLLNSGLTEYHYLKNIKLLFVESSPDEVLKTYEQLKQKGLKAQLEVLSERPKAH